ncbi:ExeM/NucH family extracellular endonuclease [Shewanella sp.]|uniref:ExeM/NucH family extracellular endonuclease n=1 Tax=Shewanella sp. TaxID=50422 RepID=UPI00404881C6
MLSTKTLLAVSISSMMAFQTNSQELLISEYVEGSSNNKAIELYNPTANTIDLSDYVLSFYFNGSTSAATNISLIGRVASNTTFVVADNDASADILALAQQTSNASFFNGDDAIVLTHNGNVVDSLGQVGVDPGAEWGSGDLSTQNNTLRRNVDNLTPDIIIDNDVSLAGWQGFAQDDITDLGSFSASGATDPTDPIEPVELVCGETAVAIHQIQGNAQASNMIGDTVEVEAIVTSDQQAGLSGIFIQMADADVDSDIATSEGIFVYTGNQTLQVNSGDRIRITAKVSEYNGTTQLSAVSQFALCQTQQALPTVVNVTLPIDDDQQLERVEGMRVKFDQALIVNDVYSLGRYGEVLLGSRRHFIGTQVATPGEQALAVTQANSKDSIILDDGSTSQNPDVIAYPAPGLSAVNTLRVGDSVTELEGVMHYGFNQYRIMPTSLVNVVQTNPRQEMPEVVIDADLRIASFNVLNYFNGDGVGAGFPTERGADSVSEFERQRAKIISAMQTINADVFGLMEIENDGYGDESAINDLVTGLNAALGQPLYDFVAPNMATLGTDAISLGMIYRTDKLSLSGAARILSSSNSPVDDSGTLLFDDGKNRPMLAQAFKVIGSDESVVVAVNHLKSKGSDCNSANDPDMLDGQGNCNMTRTRATDAIGQWLAEQYSDSKVLVIGDLNAYAKEDPLTMLASHGYHELSDYLGIPSPYSYVFAGESGQLDHALANKALLDDVVGITQWHINADEPIVLDYNEEYKSDMQVQALYQDDAFRSSDHDPVIISLKFPPVNLAPVAGFDKQLIGSKLQVLSTSTDSDGEIVALQWDFGDGVMATGTSASHQYQQSGDYHVTLTVTDNQGEVASTSQTVSVILEPENVAPVAQITQINLWFIKLFISSSYDPDGFIKHHQWLFNNGRKATGPITYSLSRREKNVELTVQDNLGEKGSTSLAF